MKPIEHARDRRLGAPTGTILALLLTALASIAVGRPAGQAPLDTLISEDAPAATANVNISRRLLPEVTTTTVPRQAPPARPPRLDDPDRGERLYLAARNTAVGGSPEDLHASLRLARETRPGDSRIPIWQAMQALRERDAGAFVWHLPGAVRAAIADPLAAPRLLVQAHQALLLLLAVFWTVLVVAGLAAVWRPLAHDLSALIMRDPRHTLRAGLPWLLVIGVLLARPGWLGALALLSIPLLVQSRGAVRHLVLATWLVTLGAVFPNWPLLREAMPVLDPASETNLLAGAAEADASSELIGDIRERLAAAEDPARANRLRLALAHQEARRGRFSASRELFARVLDDRPAELTAIVGQANNSYFLSRFDEALAGYHRARELAPDRGEIPFNQAQVYFKKLFVPEAGQALEDARQLGFAPAAWRAAEQGGAEFSAVVYLGLSRTDLRASARAEADRYPPLAWLASWNDFLSAPPLPVFLLLAGLLVIGVALAYWGGLRDEVRVCDTCGTEICRGCCSVRDEGWLCHDCAETCDRSRSEMVLATLLKNRRRGVGLATTARLVWLARLLPGSAHLALGESGRAWGRLAMLGLAMFMIVCGWAFDPAATWTTPGLVLAAETVHPLWWPLPAAAWPGALGWPVVAGWALLAGVYAVGLIDAARLRYRLPERFVQVHTGPVPGPGGA